MNADAALHDDEDRLFHEIAGRMTSGLIHEINNPLAVVMGYAQEALADPTSPHIPDDLAEIVNESRRIARLLNEWRALVRCDVSTGEADLRTSLRRVWRLFAYRSRGRMTPDGVRVPDDPADDPEEMAAHDSADDPWLCAIPPAAQLAWWTCVLMYFLDHLPARSAGTLELRSDGAQLRIRLVTDTPGPTTRLASECRQAVQSVAQRHGAAVSWPDDHTLTISLR